MEGETVSVRSAKEISSPSPVIDVIKRKVFALRRISVWNAVCFIPQKFNTNAVIGNVMCVNSG